MPFLLEVLLMLVFLGLRIWILDGLGALTWLATLAPILLVAASWRIRGDNRENLGLLPPKISQIDKMIVIAVFVIFWRIIGLTGEIWNPNFWNQEKLLYKLLTHVIFYFPWAFLQQLLLNGYFVNRLSKILPSRNLTSITVGILFAAVHWPNPVLVPVTLIGGIFSAHFFQKNRNLYLLALLHAILAVDIKYCLPDAWHHNLTIGPGYWTWTP